MDNTAVKEEMSSSSGELEWNAETEVLLFNAVVGRKPAGLCKHFQMIFIVEKFENFLNQHVSSAEIWRHLNTLYDLEAVDRAEGLQYISEDTDFCLPEDEFGNLMKEKLENSRRQATINKENSKESSSHRKDHSKSSNDGIKSNLKHTSLSISKDLHKEAKAIKKKQEKSDSSSTKKSSHKERKENKEKRKKDTNDKRKHSQAEGHVSPKRTMKDVKNHKPSKSKSSIKERKEDAEDEDNVPLAVLVHNRKEITEKILNVGDRHSLRLTHDSPSLLQTPTPQKRKKYTSSTD